MGGAQQWGREEVAEVEYWRWSGFWHAYVGKQRWCIFILTNHFVALQKSRWSHCAGFSLKTQFSVSSSHYFAQCLFHFFSLPQSGITYIFCLIAQVFFKSPFRIKWSFSTVPSRKENNEQTRAPPCNEEEKRERFSTAIPNSSVSVLFFPLCADTNSYMGGWKYMFYAARRDGCIKAQSSHFYSFVSRWRGNEGVKQMPLLREQVA